MSFPAAWIPGLIESRKLANGPIRWVAVCATAMASAWGAPSPAQVPAGPTTIISVEFDGLQQTRESFAREIVGLNPGSELNVPALEEAVARLLRTGRFLAAEYKLEQAERGTRVRFVVRERAVVTAIRFEGNNEFSERKLRKEAGQKLDEPFDVFAARETRDTIVALYRDKGYGDANVTFDESLVARTGELVFRIEEGVQKRVREIRFEGNATLPSDKLYKQIELRPKFWFFRSGSFDEGMAEADVARLRNFYRDEGFLDAEAAYRADVGPEGDIILTFTAEEGVRYSIESILFRGSSVLSETELRSLIESKEDEFVKRPTVDRDARAIQAHYGEFGHIYAEVRALRVFSQQPGFVRITFEISEGEQFRVGRVAVRGNSRTQDKVVRRALNLFPPDDLFNLTEARDAEQRLLDTRIFSTARVTPVGDEPGVRDAIIDVTEAEKAGDFLFGAGVTSNAGLVGSIVLDLQNFDLFDYPRTWSELFRFRSFYGAGQRLRLELQPGTDLGRYRVDFTEPYLFDRPLRFDLGLYLFNRYRDTYNEGRAGGTVSLGKRFERGVMRGWSGEIAFRLETVKIDDLELFTSREVREDEGNNLMTSLKGTLVRDRTDNRFLPSVGDRLRINYEQFFGDFVFGKAGVGYNWYTTLATDRLERKHVLALRGEGGIVLGHAPVFERYFAGGTGSMRGFAFRGIGERDGIDETNIGGDFLVLLGSEYSYPLYGDNLRGHIFLDTGTAGSGAYRAALGTGIRLTLNFLGPLPVELNVALPVSSDGDDDTQVFSFIIGAAF